VQRDQEVRTAARGSGKSAIYVADLLDSRDWILNSSVKR
jgi:hypothetical protein